MIDTSHANFRPRRRLIGRTPLLRLRGIEPRPGIEIYAKLEWQNPGGSVKDRAALAMILDGERTGALAPGQDPARRDVRQHRHRLRDDRRGARLPRAALRAGERHARAQADAARLRRRARPHRSDGGQRRRHPRSAPPMYERDPQRYFYPDQYSNPANWRAHYDTTALEIIEQTGGRLTHFVAGLGTSGTFVGTGRRLREWQPVGAADLGAAGVGAARPRRPEAHGARPSCRRSTTRVADRDERVSTEDAYGWSAGSRVRRACWSARQPARRWPAACASPRRSIAGRS